MKNVVDGCSSSSSLSLSWPSPFLFLWTKVELIRVLEIFARNEEKGKENMLKVSAAFKLKIWNENRNQLRIYGLIISSYRVHPENEKIETVADFLFLKN